MMAARPYHDRHEAGRILAGHVQRRLGTIDAVVLALPRGGVPVGLEVARVIHAPLDVLMVRKLGVPSHPELAMGAIAGNGFEVLNEALIAELGLSRFQIAAIADCEMEELHRREAAYRANHGPVPLLEHSVIVVDDGLATGFTMRAALGALRPCVAARLIVAVPVGAPDTCAEIAAEVDELICPLQPEPFEAVGLWYEDFSPTTDQEVCACLSAAQAGGDATGGARFAPASPPRPARW